MMKLSSRARYGMQFLIDIAENSNSGAAFVSISESAKRKNIPFRYLEQVAVILKCAGFIRSVKGPKGGYALTKNVNEIIVGDILRSLEGDILISDSEKPADTANAYEKAVHFSVFDKLNDAIKKNLDNKTLASLLGTIDSDESYMYFI
ncbi:MAG: Rrf2 family transcriptional regulator [Treponemataceae bacterium]|nr:MAG: Rrf2 family transcriptional regulator [Treponemataceae bacterium]